MLDAFAERRKVIADEEPPVFSAPPDGGGVAFARREIRVGEPEAAFEGQQPPPGAITGPACRSIGTPSQWARLPGLSIPALKRCRAVPKKQSKKTAKRWWWYSYPMALSC